MKVLTIRFSWQPGKAVGGAEQSAILHAKTLVRLDHHARALTNFGVDDPDKPYIRRIFMPANKLLGQILAFAILPWYVLAYRPDVVNPHSRFDQIALSLTKWLHRRPVVWKDPGDLVHMIKLDRKGFLAKQNQKLYLAAIKRADAIYTLNQVALNRLLYVLDELNVQGIADKFSVIPSDIAFDEYDLEAKPPQTKAKLVIGYVGRTDSFKGVQHLIKAYTNLDLDEAELWIVGDGDYLSRLKKMADGRDDIVFWGYKTKISPYMKGIDIFVQPSEFEGWGRNVKEAMYFSLPIVGSNVGGIAKQIKDGQSGLLFEPGNVEDLESKIEALVSDKKLRHKLAKQGHQQALASGDYKNLMEDQILPLFNTTLNL